MAVRLSEQNKKDLDRYTRNFVMKSLQVIVQSRMGEKCKYTAKENSGLEWVSLFINGASLSLLNVVNKLDLEWRVVQALAKRSLLINASQRCVSGKSHDWQELFLFFNCRAWSLALVEMVLLYESFSWKRDLFPDNKNKLKHETF